MPRWIWFLPLALLVVGAGLYAFRLGWLAANMTEGDAILAYAARYIEMAGPDASPGDCVAVPGQGGRVWITVICAPGDGPGWRFDVGRFGGLIDMRGPDAPVSGAPRT